VIASYLFSPFDAFPVFYVTFRSRAFVFVPSVPTSGVLRFGVRMGLILVSFFLC
jgi:hypothetical protein